MRATTAGKENMSNINDAMLASSTADNSQTLTDSIGRCKFNSFDPFYSNASCNDWLSNNLPQF